MEKEIEDIKKAKKVLEETYITLGQRIKEMLMSVNDLDKTYYQTFVVNGKLDIQIGRVGITNKCFKDAFESEYLWESIAEGLMERGYVKICVGIDNNESYLTDIISEMIFLEDLNEETLRETYEELIIKNAFKESKEKSVARVNEEYVDIAKRKIAIRKKEIKELQKIVDGK